MSPVVAFHDIHDCDSPFEVEFNSNLIDADAWFWDFGDGTTSVLPNPSHAYISGNYTVSLCAMSAMCRDTLVITDMISIGEILHSDFIVDDSLICQDQQVNFTDITLNGPDAWLWDFGDGTTSSSFSPTHIFSSRGTYDVVLSVSNSISGCTHDFLKKVTITDPIADFDYLINANHNYEDSVGCAPHEVFLNNQSQDCDYFQVLWSDGYIGCLLYTSDAADE